MSNKNHILGFCLITVTAVGGSMLMPFSSTFLINNVGVTQAQLPLIFIFTGLATLIIMPMIGRLSDRVDKFKLFAVGSVVMVAITLLYTNMPVIPLWVIIIINITMFAGISSRMIPASALNTAVPEKKDRGAYMSLCASLQQVSNGLAAMIAGIIIVQPTKSGPIEHYNTLGCIVSVTIILCVFLLYRVDRMIKARG